MEKKFKVLPPTMPNFVQFLLPAKPRGEGMNISEGMPITDFTEQEAIEYGELMKQTFIEYYKFKIKNND